MPVDFNTGTGNTQGLEASFGDDSVGNAASTKATSQIVNGESLKIVDGDNQQAENLGIFHGKPSLVAPSLSLADLAESMVPLSPEMQERLGIELGSVSLGELMKACLEKLANAQDSEKDLADLKFDLEKMGADEIELMCLLLCQASKADLIKTLKGILKTKIAQRQAVSKEYMVKQDQIAAEHAKVAEEVAKAKKAAILKAVLAGVFAVLGAAIAIAACVATCGAAAAPIAIAFSVVAAELSVAAACGTIVSSGLTIAALTTEDKEKEKNLNYANKIVGYVVMALELAAVACSITSIAKAGPKLATQAVRVVDAVSGVASASESITEGSFAIAGAKRDEKIARYENDMENLKIEMERIDQDIKFLKQFIEALDTNIQALIKNVLECEQMAATELGRMLESALKLADIKG